MPQPAVVSTRLDNAGEVTNKGIEFALSTINKSSGNLFWRTDFNFASNRNEVVNVGSRDFIVHSRVSGAGLSDLDALIILPGQPLGTFFGPNFLGYDADGNEMLSTDAGTPEASTGPLGDGRQLLGDAQPDFTFGFTNSMNYKNWDFRFNRSFIYIRFAPGFFSSQRKKRGFCSAPLFQHLRVRKMCGASVHRASRLPKIVFQEPASRYIVFACSLNGSNYMQ